MLKEQKPRQWGPLSAVRAAVQHNCDRLGIPLPFVLDPYWRVSMNVMNGAESSLYGTGSRYEPDGLRLPAAGNNKQQNYQKNLLTTVPDTGEYTWLTVFQLNTPTVNYNTLLSGLGQINNKNGGVSNQWMGVRNTSSDTFLSVNGANYYSFNSAALPLTLGQLNVAILTANKSSRASAFGFFGPLGAPNYYALSSGNNSIPSFTPTGYSAGTNNYWNYYGPDMLIGLGVGWDRTLAYDALILLANSPYALLQRPLARTIFDLVSSGETTLAPTTLAPTTAAPTTLLPTTAAPTTVAPTTQAPTTLNPTTLAPTTLAPTTLEPTTAAPTTLEPTTAAPTTVTPTTLVPTTLAPTTITPTTLSPTTIAPTTLTPTTLEPTTLAPTTVSPTTIEPTTIAPTTAAPTTIAPTTLAPTTQAPTTVAPTTAAPTTVAPTSLAPTTSVPTTSVPTTSAPTTTIPTTVEPTTVAPTTIAPTTAAPTTLLPTTSAPTTLVPTTLPPTTIFTTAAPTTLEPTTFAFTTLAPTTEVPGIYAIISHKIGFSTRRQMLGHSMKRTLYGYS